ncbi:hypothetical protein PTTG_07044 [Puccinia triticina 1-1 BBBD Race 1]|uniref:TEA domain-containing protein n=2 Tax=Puccinia triticina TaxID=208348 RepID=A0A0C4F1S3_PUCT1|nr:uncharacterized protein PtA15_2A675 [Puccinia triticina]OAV88507.1 hypothetical protein PTTG_07044 [Puccinia triticina 1-1 BBBD Race 1]WAQ82358.1 hypothetical protein PtA15_2A675 [Puccinia triticina]WAR53213.1 hypothetical protein PtB15_2B644 [Puccinia triticina]
MTSYDFFAPCSTPKRQRISSERERLVDLPIEGPSRRKTPAYLDLNGCEYRPIFSELPFDSPTARQSASKKEARSATYFPHFDAETQVLQPSFNENFNSEFNYGGKSVAENISRPAQITRGDLENIGIPFNLAQMEYHLKNALHPPAVGVENLIRAELPVVGVENLIRAEPPLNFGSQNYYFDDHWFNESVTQMASESSSYPPLNSMSSTYPPLNSMSSSSDCNPLPEFDPSMNVFASTPSFSLSPFHHENRKRCAEVALNDRSTKHVTHIDLDGMDSGSNLVDNDVKKLFNVPMLPIHVTNNFREAENIINMIRCEATKRQLYSKDRDIWSEEASRAFDEAITVIPRLGRAKILALTSEGRKPFGRNELIADYIYRRTGIVRHRKQVSSHIQVIKNSRKTEPLKNLSQNASFDRCSASWFGAFMCKDVLVLYPCTPQFPFPSQSLQHQPAAQNEKEYMAFLEEVAHARNPKLPA